MAKRTNWVCFLTPCCTFSMIRGDKKDSERRLEGEGEKRSKTEREIAGASDCLRGGVKEERRREREENGRSVSAAATDQHQRRFLRKGSNTRKGSYVRVLKHGAVFSIILMLQNPHPLRKAEEEMLTGGREEVRERRGEAGGEADE